MAREIVLPNGTTWLEDNDDQIVTPMGPVMNEDQAAAGGQVLPPLTYHYIQTLKRRS